MSTKQAAACYLRDRDGFGNQQFLEMPSRFLKMPSRQKQAYAEHLLDNMTWPEKILWSRLRHKGIGYSFQRQAIVFGFIVDFWCPAAKVVIELDGAVHDLPGRADDDKRRDELLTKTNIEILRFRNADVYRGMSAVLLRIFQTCYARAPIDLKHPLALTASRRFAETSEMKLLTAFQEAKRLEAHEKRFVLNYRKKSSSAVGSNRIPWIKGGSL
jgi:very-short-patch-repair endonuclease